MLYFYVIEFVVRRAIRFAIVTMQLLQPLGINKYSLKLFNDNIKKL